MSTPPLPEGLARNDTNQVANRLHSTAIHLLRRTRVADRETGLTPQRLSMLSVLVFAGPLSSSRLAELEQISRPAVSRTVKALVAAGLARTAKDPSDGRSVVVSATERGRQLMEAGRRRRIERIANELRGLSKKDLETLRRAAGILADAARQVPPRDS